VVHVRRRDLFAYSDFRLAIGGQLLSQASDALTSFTLAEILVFSFNSSPSLIAMASTLLMSAIPLVVVGPIAGHLADRFNRKSILVNGHLARAVIAGSAAISVLPRFHAFGYVAFALLLGLTRILYTARATAFPQLVRKHELVAADSMSLIVAVFAGSIGAGIGMSTAHHYPVFALLIAAGGQLMASRLFSFVSTDLGKGTSKNSRGHLLSAIKQLKKQKTKFAIYATASHRLILGICIASISLLVDASYGLHTTGYVAVLGFSATGAFIGSVTAEWMSEHFPRRSITVIAFGGSAIVICVASFATTPRVGLFAVSIASFLFQNLRVRSDATVQSNVSQSNMGHVFAAYDMLYNLAFIAGGILGIALSGSLSYSAVLGCAVAGFAAVSLVFAVINDGKSELESANKIHPSAWPIVVQVAAIAQ
jgi:MFS family permease